MWSVNTQSSLDFCKGNGFDRGAASGLLVGVNLERKKALATTLYPSCAGQRKPVSC